MPTLKLEKCPACGNRHTYELVVRQVPVFLSRKKGDERATERIFTKVVICPETKEQVQTMVALLQELGKRIASVEVSRIVGE